MDYMFVLTACVVGVVLPAILFVGSMEMAVNRWPKVLEWIERAVGVDLGGNMQ